MSDRYYVDERVGCIAVRDRKRDDPTTSCLDSDTGGVIRFWMGSCNSVLDWSVPEDHRQAAIKLCTELNHRDLLKAGQGDNECGV